MIIVKHLIFWFCFAWYKSKPHKACTKCNLYSRFLISLSAVSFNISLIVSFFLYIIICISLSVPSFNISFIVSCFFLHHYLYLFLFIFCSIFLVKNITICIISFLSSLFLYLSLFNVFMRCMRQAMRKFRCN